MALPPPQNSVYDAFAENLRQARASVEMAKGFGPFANRDALDVGMIYRGAWIQVVGALDHYLHQEIIRRIEAAAIGGPAVPPDVYDSSDAEPATLGLRQLPAVEVVRRLYARGLGKATIQDVRPIKEAVQLIADGDPWPGVTRLVAANWPEFSGLTEAVLKQRISEIVRRRNRIGHHADTRSDDPMLKNEIDPETTLAAINLIEAVVIALDAVLGTLPDVVANESAAPVTRRPNSVWLINEAGAVPEGTELVFEALPHQKAALDHWVEEDPRRGVATWAGGSSPLRWAIDGGPYTPTGLVKKFYREVGAPLPGGLQGTLNWIVPGQGSLAFIAEGLYYGE